MPQPISIPMPENFKWDVFLSLSAKDKAVVRPLAERLRAEGRLNNSQPSTFNSQPPRGSDWAQLESGTHGRGNLPFRDPLNKERRFLPLRFDDASADQQVKTCRDVLKQGDDFDVLKKKIIRLAAEVSGLSFGKDVIIDL